MIERLLSIVDSFENQSILVIGDLMIDEYIWGDVSRVSPEAPIPVVLGRKRENRLGGALNVVNNLKSLNAKPYVTGIIGDDNNGNCVYKYLDDNGIDHTGLIKDSSRPTTLKTRIIGNNQQIVRLDFEETDEIEESLADGIIDYIDNISGKISGIIVSDYNKGVINGKVLRKLEHLGKKGLFIALDPHMTHFKFYRNMSLITPNHHEAGKAAGIEISNDKTLHEAAEKIFEYISPQLLLITLGEKGMAMFKNDGYYKHVPTVARHVYDVTGAGDTVIAVFTLSILSNATPEEAAILSNLAAGHVVGEVGTTAILQDVLKSRITDEIISA